MPTKQLFIAPFLVEIHLLDSDRSQVIRRLAKLLYAAGFVKSTFEEAVLAREAIYPTGLPFAIGVAIPHTDSEHVNQSALAVATLKEPVVFEEMGSRGKPVSTSIVCMMAIKEPDAVVKMLRRLILVFQRQSTLEQLRNAVEREAVVEILQANMADITISATDNEPSEVK